MTTTKKKAKRKAPAALSGAMLAMSARITALEIQASSKRTLGKEVPARWESRLTALEQAQRPSSAPAELSRIVDDIKNLRPVPGDMLRAAERVLDAEESRLRDAVVEAALAWFSAGEDLGPGQKQESMMTAIVALRAHRAKPLRNWRIGRAKYQARPAAQTMLASNPAIAGKTGMCMPGGPLGPSRGGRSPPSRRCGGSRNPPGSRGFPNSPGGGGGGRRYGSGASPSAGGCSSPPFMRTSKFFRSAQNNIPVPNTAAIWPSQMNRKNFQKRRPTLFLDQLVALPIDRLDAGTAI